MKATKIIILILIAVMLVFVLSGCFLLNQAKIMNGEVASAKIVNGGIEFTSNVNAQGIEVTLNLPISKSDVAFSNGELGIVTNGATFTKISVAKLESLSFAKGDKLFIVKTNLNSLNGLAVTGKYINLNTQNLNTQSVTQASLSYPTGLSVDHLSMGTNAEGILGIHVNGLSNVGGIMVVLDYNPKYLSVDTSVGNSGVTLLPPCENGLMIVQSATPGVLDVSVAFKNPVNIPDNDIFTVALTSSDNAGTTTVTFGTNTEVYDSNDNPISVEETDGLVYVLKLLGDFYNEGTVGLDDFTAFAQHYGSSQGDGTGKYNILYDIAPATKVGGYGIWDIDFPDGVIGLQDFIVFAQNYMDTNPFNNTNATPTIAVTLTGGANGPITLANGSNIAIKSVHQLAGSIAITDSAGVPITAYATEITTSSTGLIFTTLSGEANSTFSASYYNVVYTIKVSATDPFGHNVTYLATFTIVPVTVGVGNDPNGAYGIAVDPTEGSSGTIYVAYNQNNYTLSVINGQTNTVTTTVIVHFYDDFGGLGVDPTTHMVYLASIGINYVIGINDQTNQVINTYHINEEGPYEFGVDPTTNKIYVANYHANTVSVIDGSNNTVAATVNVGSHPDAVGVDPTTHMIYVANNGNGDVSVIDGSNNTVVATIAVGSGPDAVGVDPTEGASGTIYVANDGNGDVSVINGQTNQFVATIPVGSPYGIAVDPTTGMIYIGSGNNVSVINGEMVLNQPNQP